MILKEFVEKKMPRNYQRPLPWHAQWVCDVLERGMRERKNVILELPPRHWKSELMSVYRPAWWISEGYTKNHSGIVCNAQMLADKFCQATSRMVHLQKSVDRNSEWRLVADDSLDFNYKSTGIGGQLTGFGFDDVTFDDLFKNGMEAKSEVKRNSIIDGVVSAAMNRLTPDGITITAQARLHPSDTIGWLLGTEMQFLRLHLPAVNDDGRSAWFEDQYSGDKIMFAAYDSLWPERFPRQVLEQIRNRITSYYWMAQFQQVPSLGDLSFFDVSLMPRYTMLGTITRLWIAVDCAQTETETGAYTAFVCLAQCSDGGNHLKVLHVKRGRWRPDIIAAQLIDYYNAMQRRFGVYPEAVCVERAAAGYGLLNLQMPIVPMTPRGDKEERAGAVCWLVNRGLVQVPVDAPWLKDFVDELENFPLTTYKDQVDAFVHGLAWELRKNVDFEPAMMEKYAAAMPLNPDQQLRALVEDIQIEQEYKQEFGWADEPDFGGAL
jgi:predicted phage terminase large subunit-like protein